MEEGSHFGQGSLQPDGELMAVRRDHPVVLVARYDEGGGSKHAAVAGSPHGNSFPVRPSFGDQRIGRIGKGVKDVVLILQQASRCQTSPYSRPPGRMTKATDSEAGQVGGVKLGGKIIAEASVTVAAFDFHLTRSGQRDNLEALRWFPSSGLGTSERQPVSKAGDSPD